MFERVTFGYFITLLYQLLILWESKGGGTRVVFLRSCYFAFDFPFHIINGPMCYMS